MKTLHTDITLNSKCSVNPKGIGQKNYSMLNVGQFAAHFTFQIDHLCCDKGWKSEFTFQYGHKASLTNPTNLDYSAVLLDFLLPHL